MHLKSTPSSCLRFWVETRQLDCHNNNNNKNIFANKVFDGDVLAALAPFFFFEIASVMT